MLAIPLNIIIYERGARGVPATNFFTDLGGRTEEHEHTIGASIGFESMTEAFSTTQDEAIDWLMNGLGRSVVVYDPDAAPIWEGQLTTIEAEFAGGETRSISLDELANRVTVRFTDANGNNTFQADLDLISQAAYGEKVTTVSRSSTDPVAAAAMATAILNERSNGVKKYGTTVGAGGGSAAQLRLGFSGWYTTLGWVAYANGTGNSSTTLTSTTTQVQTLITGYTSNPFLSTDYSDIVASGQTDTEFIGLDTTYRTKIEALLRIGTSTFVRQCWGVYEDRKFRVKPWAGATPDTITYQRSLRESVIRDGKGNVVPLWLVRPDAIYQVNDLLDVQPVAIAPDSAARSFVERTVCRITRDSVSLRLEGQGGDTLDDVLARLR